MRGSRGGSNKHGHYRCKYSTLCSCSAFPLSTPVCFPVTNKPVAILHVLGCRGFRGEIGSRCSAGCLHGCACPAGPVWPRGCVGAEPLPTPALPGRLGAPGPAPGHELCLGRRTKPALHLPTDPRRLPPWTIYQSSKAASHGDKPNRNSCEAGHARWVRHILPIYLLELLPPTSPGMCQHSGALSRGTPQLRYLWP